MNRRRCLARGAALAGLALAANTIAQDAQPWLEAAPRFRLLDADWQDAARGRAVPARLYLPDAAGARQRVPLVLFSHGIGGSRGSYRYLGSHFAQHGIASLHVQHVGSDRGVWHGSPWAIAARLRASSLEGEAIARVADLRFALDALLDSAVGARIDARRVVVAGHSYGASTALLAAGARPERGGHALDLRDTRLRAAIVISAPPFAGQRSPRRVLAGVGVPTLHVTSTDDVIRIPGWYSDAGDRVAVFEATGGRAKWLALFDGGSHEVFTERGGIGVAQALPIKRATRELALGFVREVLGEADDGLAEWPLRYSSLLARYVAPGTARPGPARITASA